MGSVINLPVISCYEHAIFSARCYAHGAVFSVKGNISLASSLFCVRHLVKPEDWCPTLVRVTFWSMIGGIVLLMILSILPTGLYLFHQNIHYGV